MKKIFTGFFMIVFAFAFLNNVYAQNETPKPKYMVWEVTVNPVQLDQLLDAIEIQHEYLKEVNYPFQGFVQYTNDGYFWYSSAFENYADIDKMEAADKKVWSSESEKVKEIQKNFEGSFSSIAGIILELQPELSIIAPSSDVIPSGTKFRHFEKLYLKQGTRAEFEAALKKYLALREKHGYTANMYTLYPTFDKNLSVVYFVDELGDNAVDFYTKNDEKWKKFGDEGAQLWEEIKPLVERIESHTGIANYDKSYFPQGN